MAMMTAAILFGTGIMVELCAVVFAPMGYQDENGFHKVADHSDDKAPAGAKNPG